MLNRIILIGRLTRDPELRFTVNGKAVANFTLAVDRGWGEQKETDFIDIVVWDKSAENSAQYLKKGRLAGVEGRLQIRQYEHEGQKRRAAEVVASRVIFLERDNKGGASGEGDTTAPWVSGGVLGPDDVPF